MSASPKCLRCSDAELARVPSTEGVEFFRCPQCGRDYARMPGKQLTYRWKHPISIPLYLILFERDPIRRVVEIADAFPGRNSFDRLRRNLDEIEHELDYPTQRIREILDNPQSEQECREFLKRFCSRMRDRLAGKVPLG